MAEELPSAETFLTVRVSYAETDQMGVVNSGWYLRWLELGRTEFIRLRGKTYKQCEQEGVFLPVAEVHLRYRKSATYDELIEVATSLTQLGRASLTFAYRILRPESEELIASGWTKHAVTNRDGKIVRIPPHFSDLLRQPPQ